jgi:DNA repair exonuclease SbcCD nuclease subunit
MSSTLTNSEIRNYLVMSDIHLGARSTPAEEIMAHITGFFDSFSDKSPLAALDVLFLAGDLWDDTIVLASNVLSEFIPFWRRWMA